MPQAQVTPVRGRAVVVGAGIGGLAAALGLRRAGWNVTVLDRAGSPELSARPDVPQALQRYDEQRRPRSNDQNLWMGLGEVT